MKKQPVKPSMAPSTITTTVYYATVSQTAKRWGCTRQCVYRHAATIAGVLLRRDECGRRSILIPTDAVRPASQQGKRTDLGKSRK